MRAGGQIVVISEAFHSGSGRYLQALANELARLRPLVLVAPRHEREADFTSAVARRVLPAIAGLRPAILKAFGMQYQTLCRMAQAVALRRHAAAFLVLFPGNIIFALQLLLLLRLLGRPIVLNIHDIRPHARHLPLLPQALENLFGACYRLAQRIVVLTGAAADELHRRHGLAAPRVVVIPHGIFALGKTPLSVPSLPGRFLVFGALRANKSIRESIAAVQSLRRAGQDVVLTIAGQPQEAGYWEDCKRLIAAAPDGIEIREGYIEDGDLPALFASCSAVLLPYRAFSSQAAWPCWR